ncbi:glycosyltransferase family 2 protein [Salinibacterium sp. SYSU T00001]|uniref:glycosyltransferase family 2 protein n=1 Tax=Homoserinimonas sedimenticola TaxID=2986805 RepID=UPI00223614ED|nr:glycosyltransferase family 2 protein [Salinibacterium sedimenticola]MCW4384448.1 glycosyltransferase family 2 protein [Salinibacterium sedimenticola]
MPSVSVVIPSWNDAELLSDCLAALARQTRLADEIVVVDNASTDATAEVARRFGARVVQEDVRGILRATAAGFDAAHGDILARLDADSIPAPDWLETVVAHLGSLPTPAAVAGPGEFRGASAFVRWFGRRVYLGGYFRAMAFVLGQPPLFGSNMAMQRQAWEAVRPRLDVSARAVHDDLYISIRLPREVQVAYDAELRVSISARPFASPTSIGKRMLWGCNTLLEGTVRGRLLQRRAARRRARAKL